VGVDPSRKKTRFPETIILSKCHEKKEHPEKRKMGSGEARKSFQTKLKQVKPGALNSNRRATEGKQDPRPFRTTNEIPEVGCGVPKGGDNATRQTAGSRAYK